MAPGGSVTTAQATIHPGRLRGLGRRRDLQERSHQQSFFGIKRGTAIAKLLFAPAPDPRIKGKLYWRRPARAGLTGKTQKNLPLGSGSPLPGENALKKKKYTSRTGVLPSRSN